MVRFGVRSRNENKVFFYIAMDARYDMTQLLIV